MVLEANDTVFDVLACLCSFLNRDDERMCAVQYATALRKDIKTVTEKYKNFMGIIANSALNEYRFSIDEIAILNGELLQLQKEKENCKGDIYRLAIEVEHSIEPYCGWQNEQVVFEMKSLNSNEELTEVYIYPCTYPCWNREKSERNRERTLNACFTNYMMIRQCDMKPFEFVMHYWNDTGLLRDIGEKKSISVALSPVMDGAVLKTCSEDSEDGMLICVEELENGDTVSERVLLTFDHMFEKQYSIIVFPETLGIWGLVDKIKARMRKHPDYCTIVLLPTICENKKNRLVVLGPGGIECLVQGKNTPFILWGENGERLKEKLDYDNKIHLLITKELGIIAFPICADLLDPDYYYAITNVARVNTIVCPSFSPGTTAFEETMLKGIPLKILQLYVNTCSAKSVSRSGVFKGEVAMVQVPYVEQGTVLEKLEKKCSGECARDVCYFDLMISWSNKTFLVESVHRCA